MLQLHIGLIRFGGLHSECIAWATVPVYVNVWWSAGLAFVYFRPQ